MKSILDKKTVLIISLILILTLIISTSYAFFISSDSQTNVASTACFELSFSASNTISLEHSYPISEAEAENLTPYTFTIKNICKEASSYDVIIEDLNSSDLDLSAIRYKLDNEQSAILGSVTPNQTKVLTTSKTSRTIASGMLLYNEQITYNIKLWIDENASKNQTANKSFESKIIVVSSMDKDPYYTVTVNPNNGDSSYTKRVVKGRNLGSITEPTKVGYTFEGWYKDSQLTQSIDSSSSITQDENIYAKFTPNQYTINFNTFVNGVNASSKTVTYDLTYGNLPTPVWGSNVFLGWYSDVNYTNKIDSNTKVSILENQTLYARWKDYNTITNMFVDGSFENGVPIWPTPWGWSNITSTTTISSWDCQSVNNYAFAKYGSKSMRVAVNTADRIWITNHLPLLNAPINHKIYVRINSYVEWGDLDLGLTVRNESTNTNWEENYIDNYTGYINSPVSSWQARSLYFTSTYNYFLILLGQASLRSDSYVIFYDGLIFVDLTATYGSGNEPTQSWCDSNLQFFDGTTIVKVN